MVIKIIYSQLGFKLKEVENLLYWLSLHSIQNSLMIIWLVDALSDKTNQAEAQRIERQIETIMVNSDYQGQPPSAQLESTDTGSAARNQESVGRLSENKMLKSTYNNRIITFVYSLIKFSLNAKLIP